METYFDLVSKRPAAEVIVNWLQGMRWKDQADTDAARNRPIQSVRVINEQGTSIYAASAKNSEDWTEAQACIDLIEALEQELMPDLHPRAIKLKILLSPFADEKEARTKTFSLINLAQMTGRSLRPDELGESSGIEGAPPEVLNLKQAFQPIVKSASGMDVTVNLSELLKLSLDVQERAYRPVYELVNMTVDSVKKVHELHKALTVATMEVLSQHPQVTQHHYAHEEAIKRLQDEHELNLERTKQESKAKVIGHALNTIGSTPEGQEQLLNLLGNLNKLIGSN